ncbi:MAG: Adenylate cyclase [Chthonomonadaceae bacterium]|nr:Adenylate cyclase [Chthonomonadaceae bacterium]
MDQELEKIAGLLREARDPEDLFGTEPIVLPRKVLAEQACKRYDGWKRITSATYLSPDDNDVAQDLDRRLETLYRQAQIRIEAGAYNLQGRGQLVPMHDRSKFFDVGGKRYYIGSRFRQGDETTLYNGYLERDGVVLGEVLLKVALSPETSPFMEREANALALMRKEEYRETAYLPFPMDRFDAGGRMGSVMRRVDGFNLREVRQDPLHRTGVKAKDMVWMLSRALAGAGLAHRYGVVHGRISPEHVVIDPVTHLGMIVGWGGSVISPARSGQRLLAPIPTFSAPEAAQATIGPWSDVFSIGKTFLWLLGGDPATDTLPEQIEPRLAAFLRNMVNIDPYQRPEDCWQLLDTLDRLKVELWGEKKWRVFEMPTPNRIG